MVLVGSLSSYSDNDRNSPDYDYCGHHTREYPGIAGK